MFHYHFRYHVLYHCMMVDGFDFVHCAADWYEEVMEVALTKSYHLIMVRTMMIDSMTLVGVVVVAVATMYTDVMERIVVSSGLVLSVMHTIDCRTRY